MISSDENVRVECQMISANTNTLLKGADYSNTYSCFIFASSNLIHVYDTKRVRTFLTLKGHKQRVNSVKWIDNIHCHNKLIEFLSCSSDGTVIHWVNTKDPYDYYSWKDEKVYTSSTPNDSVNCLESLYVSPIEKYYVTFSSSGTLDLWYYDVDLNEYKLFYSLNSKKKLQDTLCLTVLNENYLLLLTGGYDCVVNVYTVMRIKKIQGMLMTTKEEDIVPCSFKLSLAGHINSIRDIAATNLTEKGEFYFASASQDTYIRMWHVIPLEKREIKSIADSLNSKGSLSIYDEYKSKTSYVIKTDEDDYFNIILDSVLSGHEESVSSLRWGYLGEESIEKHILPVLLTSSFDFSVGLWKFDEKNNIWNKEITLGEMVGNKHAFFSAVFVEKFTSILAYSYNGAFYLWRKNKDTDNCFKSMPVIHGHFGPVSDLDWDTSKNILFTSSEDQTTRAFGYWKDNQTWNEINRPQIHGYNLRTISCLTENENEKDNYICKLVSGAEEKLIRVFTAPFNIISFTNYLTGVNINFSRDNDNAYYEKLYANLEGTKQALGLMNRMNVQDEEEDNNDYSNFEPDVLTNKEGRITSKINYYVPPDEDLLTNNTLWPEFNKLYGHGYELMAIATSHDGKFIASSGKAQSEKNAKLFIWTTENSKLSCKLEGHVLTIVQIEFSHNDEFILTVSRDRSWCVYKRNDTGTSYEMFQIEKEAHGRIIWGCSWSHDDSLFITGSRDKSIQLWKKNVGDQTNFTLAARKELKDSVTAVNFLPILLKDSYAFLVGYESGEIELMSYSNGEIKLMHTFHKFISHGSSVTRIKSIVNNSFNGVLVGTCSEDHSVRIFEIKL